MAAVLDPPFVCLVTDRRRCAGRRLEDVVACAVDGGVGMVQLREKDLPARRLLAMAGRLRGITDGRALLFVNDRLDVALAAGADGVQLAEDGLPVFAARSFSRGRLLVGRSVHTVEGAVAAEREGANLLVAGTIFPTASHPDLVPQGVEFVEQLATRVHIPFLAIGGVTCENVEAVMESGAAGAAVITAITESEDPADASRQLVEVVERGWTSAQQRPRGNQAS